MHPSLQMVAGQLPSEQLDMHLVRVRVPVRVRVQVRVQVRVRAGVRVKG